MSLAGADVLRDFQRMPFGFGPAPGPRNLPAGQAHRRYDGESTTFTITARTDREALIALLPDRLTIGENALLNISFVQLRKLGWLAGRGYNILALAIPVVSKDDAAVTGVYLPVLWENHADPIITGREELGYPKIFGDLPDPVVNAGACEGYGAWDGFRFFEFSMWDLQPEEAPAPTPPPRTFVQKYIPSTFEEGRADVSYLTVSGPGAAAGHGPDIKIVGAERGKGRFCFHRARWEDMPTQYTIVNRLADLPLYGFQGARIIRRTGQDDVSGQHAFP